jgi:2-polyprenyl-3-methyl-5-hydroxy-6-metoxy-1,4-benzoquinol methylase
LEYTRQEISACSEETRIYFDTSFNRYLETLGFLNPQKPARLLDLGCSPGHLAMALSLSGLEVTGLDFHEEYPKRYLPEQWRQRLDIRYADLEREPLPFPDNSFDYITCCEMIEHLAIRHPKEIMTEAFRVLRPGGVMVLSTPQAANLGHVLALCQGTNVFWKEELFYGGLDRHNREFTFLEIQRMMAGTPFQEAQYRLCICDANWNTTSYELTSHVLGYLNNSRHPIPAHLKEDAQWALKFVDLYLRRHGLKKFDASLPFFNNTVLARMTKPGQ